MDAARAVVLHLTEMEGALPSPAVVGASSPSEFSFMRAVVVKAHHATDDSQLELRLGDVVFVLEQDDSGWWGGHKDGEDNTGWFPGSCVREQPAEPAGVAPTSIPQNAAPEARGLATGGAAVGQVASRSSVGAVGRGSPQATGRLAAERGSSPMSPASFGPGRGSVGASDLKKPASPRGALTPLETHHQGPAGGRGGRMVASPGRAWQGGVEPAAAPSATGTDSRVRSDATAGVAALGATQPLPPQHQQHQQEGLTRGQALTEEHARELARVKEELAEAKKSQQRSEAEAEELVRKAEAAARAEHQRAQQLTQQLQAEIADRRRVQAELVKVKADLEGILLLHPDLRVHIQEPDVKQAPTTGTLGGVAGASRRLSNATPGSAEQPGMAAAPTAADAASRRSSDQTRRRLFPSAVLLDGVPELATEAEPLPSGADTGKPGQLQHQPQGAAPIAGGIGYGPMPPLLGSLGNPAAAASRRSASGVTSGSAGAGRSSSGSAFRTSPPSRGAGGSIARAHSVGEFPATPQGEGEAEAPQHGCVAEKVNLFEKRCSTPNRRNSSEGQHDHPRDAAGECRRSTFGGCPSTGQPLGSTRGSLGRAHMPGLEPEDLAAEHITYNLSPLGSHQRR